MEVLWASATVALLIVGVVPGLVLSWRGTAVQRLVGLALLNGSAAMVLVGLAAVVGQSSYLIVPLVLAVLATTGTLVYTRLLRPEVPDRATEGAADRRSTGQGATGQGATGQGAAP